MSADKYSASALTREGAPGSEGLTDQHQALRLWLKMISCTNLIENKIRKRLNEQFAFTLPRFDYLAQLDREPDGMTMGELSKRMMVTGGNVTGLTDQLVRDDLVVREMDSSDRRVYRIRMTAKGAEKFREMAAEHEVWIREIMSVVDDHEIDQCLSMLARIKKQAQDI
ncbi:MarR family winged helix-turn-helix transcriptional regulator [Nitrincola alkalilacustris]|uniref:MarR family winged helix-turn-helix transcriptional regulator n=1 Tax=Nitrincola alkalilacustris TaxID=1571224 RepID=UPI00197D82E3|nr:MarR family transcriptional regulator [Nitrincola alkalilacustris]